MANNKKAPQNKKVDENAQIKKQVKKVAKKATKKALKNRNVQIAIAVIVVLLVIALVVVYFVKPEIFDFILNPNTDNTGSGGNKNNGTGHVIDGASVVMTVIDVGQGDGIYIEFPTGENMFIDGGTEFQKPSRWTNITDVFTANNVTKLDYYMLTHLDYDHIRYTKQICDLLEIKHFYIPYIYEEYLDNDKWYTSTWITAYTAIKAETYTENGATKNAVISTNISTFDLGGDSWVMHCYTYEQADYPPMATLSSKGNWASDSHHKNSISPVCFLQYAGRTICLTGDQNEEGEEYLNNKGYFDAYDVDVLKVAHHGSREGTNKATFLDKVDPEYAIISVGAENGYKHPHTELITRLNEYQDVTPDTDANGIQKVYKTSEDGNVTVTIASTGTIDITSANDSSKNVQAVACVMYGDNNNIEIVYVAYIKKEGEE
ncbi:MAG: hypothetical protein K5923_00530 [Clostridia bacterium]|nr:hypothetical protein [Clostridia bacterium]